MLEAAMVKLIFPNKMADIQTHIYKQDFVCKYLPWLALFLP